MHLKRIVTELNAPEYTEPLVLPSEEVMAHLDDLDRTLKTIGEKAVVFAEFAEIMESETPSTEILDEAVAHFEERRTIWGLLDKWRKTSDAWLNSKEVPFIQLDCGQAEKDTAEMYKQATDLWKRNKEDTVTLHLKHAIEEFKQYLPLMLELGGESMRFPIPWAKVFSITPGTPPALHIAQAEVPDFTMNELIEWGVFDPKLTEQIEEVCTIASGEYALQQTLAAIAEGWASAAFEVRNYREEQDLYILNSIEDISMLLEDNQVTLQTILSSRYVLGIKEQVDEWDVKLRFLSEVLEEWTMCQRAWLYLENIFAAADIKKQLPLEAAKFSKVLDSLNMCNIYF